MKKVIDREFIEQVVKRELAKCQQSSERATSYDGELIQDSYCSSECVGQSGQSIRQLTDREAQRFERAIINGVIDGLSIEELAKSCCYSLSTFKRRFNEYYNLPPHRWILRCRLNLACLILSTTDESISDVASICGFVNNSHFIATFRRHFALTPRQYRTVNMKRD
jgi:AraC-like DNA-binding protein